VIKEIRRQAEGRALSGKGPDGIRSGRGNKKNPTENSPGGLGESRDEIAKLAQAHRIR